MTSVLSDFFEKALRRGGGIFYHTIIELNNENQFNILTINNIIPCRLGMPDNTVSLAFLTEYISSVKTEYHYTPRCIWRQAIYTCMIA